MTDTSSDAAAQGFALERDDDVVRLVDPTGARWRVYDTTFSSYRHHIQSIGSGRATARMFVPPDREAMRRSYEFRPGDSRAVTLNELAAQWQKASYSPAKRYDTSERQPR